MQARTAPCHLVVIVTKEAPLPLENGSTATSTAVAQTPVFQTQESPQIDREIAEAEAAEEGSKTQEGLPSGVGDLAEEEKPENSDGLSAEAKTAVAESSLAEEQPKQSQSQSWQTLMAGCRGQYDIKSEVDQEFFLQQVAERLLRSDNCRALLHFYRNAGSKCLCLCCHQTALHALKGRESERKKEERDRRKTISDSVTPSTCPSDACTFAGV